MNKWFDYQTQMGQVRITYNQRGVVSVMLPYDQNLKETSQGDHVTGGINCEEPMLKSFLDDFFSMKSPEHKTINLDIQVTAFQKKVYDLLLDTVPGTLLTYGDVAKLIGCGSPRAVGQALRKNPVPIIIPCHRIVGSGWEGGFAGKTSGLEMDFKRYLIELEKNP